MRLVHFANYPITHTLRKVVQMPEPAYKPHGLWVSDEDAREDPDTGGPCWSEWHGENMPDFHGDDPVTYEVVLADNHGVLLISTPTQLDAFTQEYGSLPSWRYVHSRSYDYIDWKRVAENHTGVIITPYLWTRRMDVMWYYGWDCASGCIWDPITAIASFTQTQRDTSDERSVGTRT